MFLSYHRSSWQVMIGNPKEILIITLKFSVTLIHGQD